ncbi:MAG: MFS transporter [Chloroflexi bacterium]|nr:MFS transporter [Chloroflexota bacterium]
MITPDYPVDDRRELFGWAMYDWANSAFVTTVATVLIGPYLTALAQGSVGENGAIASLGLFGTITAKSFFPQCVSISVFMQLFLLPVLGGIADYTNLKRRLLGTFCAIGSVATVALYFVEGENYLVGGLLYIIANICLGASMVLYNAFLNDIASPSRRDGVSSHGYAMGYVGGGTLLAANLVLITFAGSIGISKGEAVRISLLSAGVWWGGWGLFSLRFLRARPPSRVLAPRRNWLIAGFSEIAFAVGQLRRLPQTVRYLLAYTLYNDGIQTVIGLSSVFLAQELFSPAQRAAGDDTAFLTGLILMVQFVAFFGATGFERLARLIGARDAVLGSLVVWCGIVVYAYAFLDTTTQALGMGATIAVVLGGSQALSRSLFSRLIPHGQEATYFGVYEISERGTSWIGPQIFALVVASTGSYRDAILSLMVLFVTGTIMLFLTDIRRAESDVLALAASAKPA